MSNFAYQILGFGSGPPAAAAAAAVTIDTDTAVNILSNYTAKTTGFMIYNITDDNLYVKNHDTINEWRTFTKNGDYTP
jgi:hypothetical protein